MKEPLQATITHNGKNAVVTVEHECGEVTKEVFSDTGQAIVRFCEFVDVFDNEKTIRDFGLIKSKEYDEIIDMVKANDGYCPCVLKKTKDTMCICKTVRNGGTCICGLFEK